MFLSSQVGKKLNIEFVISKPFTYQFKFDGTNAMDVWSSMVGSFETYRGFVYLTSSGDAKNYGGKTCRYGGGQKKETLIYQRKSQLRFLS